MLKWIIAFVAITLGVGSYICLKDDRPTVEMAESIVQEAIDYIAEVGPEKAIKEMNVGGSKRWCRGALYLFMYQVEPLGYMVAHGVNEGLVNKNLYDLTDPDGKLFVKEYLDKAIQEGHSVVHFKWPNPETRQIEKKVGVCRLSKDKKYVVCSGAYK